MLCGIILRTEYHFTVRSLLSFLFLWPTGTIALIPTCGKRKVGIRCRGDGYNTKVPRVDTNQISSFARIFTLSILLVIMWTFLFLWNLYSVFLCFRWDFFFWLFIIINLFCPPQGTGQPSSADFWSLSWIRTIAICTLSPYFVPTLNSLMWSRLIPLQGSRHRRMLVS